MTNETRVTDLNDFQIRLVAEDTQADIAIYRLVDNKSEFPRHSLDLSQLHCIQFTDEKSTLPAWITGYCLPDSTISETEIQEMQTKGDHLGYAYCHDSERSRFDLLLHRYRNALEKHDPTTLKGIANVGKHFDLELGGTDV